MMADVLRDLPECFAHFGQSRGCADCPFKELCRKLIYKQELAGAANHVLEMIEELERRTLRIELILGASARTSNERALRRE